MKTKADSQESQYDGVKWTLVVLLVAVAVAGNAYFSEESLLYRVLAVVAIALVAGFVALQTAKGKQFVTLVRDARIEMRKVVWPTRQETTQTTLIVVAVVLLMALVLWALDSLLSWAVSGVIG